MATKIGLSLSLCVKDIATGVVAYDDVVCIISNTRADDEASRRQLYRMYSESSWADIGTRAWVVYVRLQWERKLVQPRLDNPYHCHSISNGHWIELEPV